MGRYLLKAPDESFDRWRAAAGEQSLAGWIRARLDEAAAERVGLEKRAVAVLGREARHVPGGARVEVLSAGSFKPDFGKRLKP